MKLFLHIPSWLKNKYILSLIGFAVLMLFFDRNDFFTQRQRRHELNDLKKSKAYYEGQIKLEKTVLEQLKEDPATLEKYAREKYLMKKDNEDIFIIPDSE